MNNVNKSKLDLDLSGNGINNMTTFPCSPLSSTPNMAYQQQFPPLYPVHPLLAQTSPGFESSLKEICQKITNVELKLSKLDKIEERLNIMDKKFKSIDGEVLSCKQRLDTLEQSAQFLSDVRDEHQAIKKRLDKITSGIESAKNFGEKLLDIETQSLENNMLFFFVN